MLTQQTLVQKQSFKRKESEGRLPMKPYIIKYNGQTIETLPVSEISPAEIKRQVVQVWPELESAEMIISNRIITFNLPRGTKQ